jgi:hypothetical protein
MKITLVMAKFTIEQATEEQLYSSKPSLSSALDSGGWSAPRSVRFTHGNDPVPIVYEAIPTALPRSTITLSSYRTLICG